jgi:sirohydrochlorin ferrochelatase
MTSAILFGHGSPCAWSKLDLQDLRCQVAIRLDRPVALGVLEFATQQIPSLRAAFQSLPRGEPVAAQPLLLFEGLHGGTDMPAAAAQARDQLGLDVRLGEPFGDEPRLLDLCTQRLHAMGPRPGDVLLFVGRGTSSPLAMRQTEEVSARLARATGFRHAVCHAGISRPDLVDGLRLAIGMGARRVLALPYLIHGGILVRRVEEVLALAARHLGVDLFVLPHIGNAPQLVEVVVSRLEALT